MKVSGTAQEIRSNAVLNKVNLGLGDGIVDSLEIGVVVVSAAETIVGWNPWMDHHTGYSADEVLGRAFDDVLGPMTPRVRAAVVGVLRSGRPGILSPALHHAPFAVFESDELKDRERRLEHVVHLRPLRHLGDAACGIQVVDMSAAMRREALLQQRTREAMEARKSQQDFLSRMSHEIRTPLNGVLALTELVLQTKLDEEQRRNLSLVHESGESLLRIVNDVLDLSKIEAGKMTLETMPSSLQQILLGVEGVLRLRAHQKGIELLSHTDDSIPNGLEIDPTRLRQVMLNLVGNAIKFTNVGSVSIETRYVVAAPEPENLAPSSSAEGPSHGPFDGEVFISVTDTGIGIENPETLFEEFSQADKSISRRFGGSGLGLSISRRLVELMGGEIQVKSRLGEGSCFSVRLPVRHAQTVEPATNVPTSGTTGGGCALVVDDNRVNRLVASKVLERLGFEVVVATGGQEALSLLCAEGASISVVLMDCHMPEMDGYETSRRIRALLGVQLPIIAVTANAMPGERERCLDAGMNEYLTKPITIRGLSEALKGVEKATASPASAPAVTLREVRSEQ